MTKSHGASSNPAAQPFPPDYAPFAMELRIQGAAAEMAFKSLEAHLDRRRELARSLAEIFQRGGPPPLKLEQEAFQRDWQEYANLIGPILGDLQSFFSAVGVVASILWPSTQPRRGVSKERMAARIARGEWLREKLQVPATSSLRMRTGDGSDARGGLLHFDEMVEEFERPAGTQALVTFDVGSSEVGSDTERGKAIRWLDEDKLVLWVNKRSRNLREVLTDLRAVVGRVNINAQFRPIWKPGATTPDTPPMGVTFAVGTREQLEHDRLRGSPHRGLK